MLRDRLWAGLSQIEEVYLNGDMDYRVPHNLNVSFNYVEGESLIMAIKELAVSSGSACTSASLEPSYVLHALGPVSYTHLDVYKRQQILFAVSLCCIIGTYFLGLC